MLVCRERPEDVAGARAVQVAAFGRELEATLLDELRVCDAWIPALSFVARSDDGVVGHVVCTRAHVAGTPVVALGPIGVSPALHGRGVGAALMHTVLGAADAMGEPLVGLLGDPAFYRRFGFVVSSAVGIEPPVAQWGPHFQVRPLAVGAAGVTGTFRYAAPFENL
nr:N-acetyltransferase [Kibdelosporangium sp. MJ126-NF4]CEL13764.1 GCN5-related N-acetyltransferase [Kibdelosporangium sp. MJ126-NF4]CTQ99450.1 GCN5-related N-acetyltransferase [Kibdelosporangium sp. MJ126-NF4]